LLASDRAFYAAMLRELASEFRRALKSLKSQKLRDGSERIAAFLLELQQAQDGAETVVLPADRKTVASYLGMTRENLSRSLQKIGNYGAAVRGNEVVIRDPDSLRAHADFSPLMDDIEDGQRRGDE
jgi:CRP/FNR family transcriptional activator FtrB